jgi:NAD(P)H-dependent FMN reductase
VRPTLLVISSSLSPTSRSRILARAVHERLRLAGHAAEFLDLAACDLPLCEGDGAAQAPAAVDVRRAIAEADGIALSFPIYNYDAGAAAKNLIELTGSAWEDKVVAMLCAAGARTSYMAPMSLAASLMLDFRCHIVPRFLMAVPEDFRGDSIESQNVRARIDDLAADLARVTVALRGWERAEQTQD